MSESYICSPEGQKDVVTALFAKSACHQEEGPCSVCMDFCRENITPRTYPVIKQALLAAVQTGDIDAGFGALLMGITMMSPAPWDPQT